MTTPTAAAAAAAQVTPEVEGAFPSTTPQSSDTLGPQTTDQPTTSVSQTSTAIPSSTPTFPWFESNWNAPASFVENVPQQVYYQINDIPNLDGVNFDPVLFVCQTNASDPTLMDSSNTWSVAQIPNGSQDPSHVLHDGDVVPNTAQFLSNGAAITDTSSYFFCLANNPQYINDFTCDSYGPMFNISGPASRGVIPRQTPPVTPVSGMPTTPLSIVTHSGALGAMGQTVTSSATVYSSQITTLAPPVGTTTMTTTLASTTSTSTSKSLPNSSNGLSTGAKVGIALGALVLVALLLIGALFFLRRKHRSRSPPPEQVMLTRDMHNDSFSRNALIAEKENSSRHSVAHPAPADEHLPIQRHSSPSPTPYDSIPAAPYNEPVAELPRRKPTNASAISRISGPASPRSLTVSTPPDEYEEYRDQPMPVYGDARHSPRVYSTEERQGVQAPFLTEEGMSAEEVARLEEEERRIDAAIAEAERNGRR